MAVFRIEKTRDYTVMANHHLRNTALSLKAKGLLSLMLSLPEDWDYTTKGLARICRDGVDSICATVRELEDAGYIIRERVRNANGRHPAQSPSAPARSHRLRSAAAERDALPRPVFVDNGQPVRTGSGTDGYLVFEGRRTDIIVVDMPV